MGQTTQSASGALVETRDLAVGYEGRVLVGGIRLKVCPGQVVTLIGPNGAGKSTILKTIAGQLAALGGCVLLSGKDLSQLPVRARAQELSVMLTDRVRTELLTCADVVEMGRYPYTGRLGGTTPEDRQKVQGTMELLQVWDLRDRDFMQLSDGQRQRVLLARAVCQEPRALVLDEPTSHLDVRYQIELLTVLRHLAHDQGLGILVTLHELPFARRVSDWLVCVKDGVVTLQGTPEQVFVPSVIDALYDLTPGSYDALTGDVLLPEAQGHGREDDAQA
ncbi:MAG: ABC transporter ATP-binding protein [Atopobiaceae bacterium]|nr:ABC transporter ATP-binding protein [Atopobiaceae bacterium]